MPAPAAGPDPRAQQLPQRVVRHSQRAPDEGHPHGVRPISRAESGRVQRAQPRQPTMGAVPPHGAEPAGAAHASVGRLRSDGRAWDLPPAAASTRPDPRPRVAVADGAQLEVLVLRAR